jgi:hypothetical protein
MCYIREYDFSLIPMYYKKKINIKKTEIFTHTLLNIDESRNLTMLKYTSRSNPNTPFLISKSLKTNISLNSQLFIIC